MATRAAGAFDITGERRFFFGLALAMTVTIVAGFSVQLAMGRSSFHAPLLVHLHALTFFGWTFFYLLQNALVATGSVATHRRLGWIGAAWATAVVVLGTVVTIVSVRHGRAPFFFTPAYFLLMNPLGVLTFGGLFAAAIRMRRRADWHRRLMACGMAMLCAPAFGRLLPLPFMIPWAGWGVLAAVLVFPAAGMVRDRLRRGAVHPAWAAGVAAMVASYSLAALIAPTAAAAALYDAVAAGTPAAAIAPRDYPPPPWAHPAP